MKVFFDANILISLFRLTNEDLESLRKLVSASNLKKFQLVTTPHLRDEYERYREKAISDGISAFSSTKIGAQFPPFVRGSQKFIQVSQDIKKLKVDLRELETEVREQAEARNLLIDEIIGELFSSSHVIEESLEIVSAARLRLDKGNPPGKKAGNIGDALHWESLLSDARPYETLVIVSKDGDFASELHRGKPKKFLAKEWSNKTNGESDLVVLDSLSSFVGQYARDIEVDSEFSAPFLVEELFESYSYRRTHEIIDLLRGAPGLTVSLIWRIMEAIEANPKVGNLVGEPDFQEYLADLYEGFSSSEVGAELLDHLGGGWV